MSSSHLRKIIAQNGGIRRICDAIEDHNRRSFEGTIFVSPGVATHMDIDETIQILLKHRQAFAFGATGVETLFNTGADGGRELDSLQTKVADEDLSPAFFLPRVKLNEQLKQATMNRLAMQLVVGVGDAVETYIDNWADYPHPTIRFLRVIRNGAGHDNRVLYTDEDPRPDTEWRGIELTDDLEGAVIFTDIESRIWGTESVAMEEGFIEAGDALALTTDVLKIFLPNSDTYDVDNVVGLSEDESWDI